MSAVDDDVRARRLTPEEGAEMRLEIQTNISPLANRQRQAQILQTQVQTQGAHQHNQMQAQLFNEQQAYRARSIQDSVVEVNGGLYHRDFNGNITPLDPHAASRADMVAMSGVYRDQSLLPGQIRHQDLTNAALLQHTDHLRDMHPLQREGLQSEIALRVQQFQRNGQMLPLELQQAAANVGLTQAHTGQIGQQTEQSRQLFPSTLSLSQSRAGLAENELAFAPRVSQATLDDLVARGLMTRAHASAIANADSRANELHPGAMDHQDAANRQIEANIDHITAATGLTRAQTTNLRPWQSEIVRQMAHDVGQGLAHERERWMAIPGNTGNNAPPVPSHLRPENETAEIQRRMRTRTEGYNANVPEGQRLPLGPAPAGGNQGTLTQQQILMLVARTTPLTPEEGAQHGMTPEQTTQFNNLPRIRTGGGGGGGGAVTTPTDRVAGQLNGMNIRGDTATRAAAEAARMLGNTTVTTDIFHRMHLRDLQSTLRTLGDPATSDASRLASIQALASLLERAPEDVRANIMNALRGQ